MQKNNEAIENSRCLACMRVKAGLTGRVATDSVTRGPLQARQCSPLGSLPTSQRQALLKFHTGWVHFLFFSWLRAMLLANHRA